MSYFCGILLLLLTFVGTARAEHRFMLRAHEASIQQICSQFGLTLLKSLPGKNLHIVSAPSWVDPDRFKKLVAEHADVDEIESDKISFITERQSPGSEETAASAALKVLYVNTTTLFFGQTVWSSYADQPAMQLTGIDSLHRNGIDDDDDDDDDENRRTTGGGIVAIIDTGVDPEHPYLKGFLVGGYDFIRDIPGGSEMVDLDQSTKAILDQSTKAILDQSTKAILDQSTKAILDQSTKAILDEFGPLPALFGHGTMVAGLIHRAAPTARLMPLKVFNADGTALNSNIVRAIYYAADNGAAVINMSFSIAGLSEEIVRAINYATRKGVICVGSVGNEGTETIVYTAALANVIGVASTTLEDSRSTFSNYGSDLVMFAAPGEGLITTFPGGHAAVSGTSFITAIVSGAVALLVGVDANTHQDRVASSLAHAKVINEELGYGRIALVRALRAYFRQGQDWPLLDW